MKSIRGGIFPRGVRLKGRGIPTTEFGLFRKEGGTIYYSRGRGS